MDESCRHVSMLYRLPNRTLDEVISFGGTSGAANRVKKAWVRGVYENASFCLSFTGYPGSALGIQVRLGEIFDMDGYEHAVRQFISEAGPPNHVLSGSDFVLLEEILKSQGMELRKPGFGLSRLAGDRVVAPVKQIAPQPSYT